MHVLLVLPWYKPEVGGVVTSIDRLTRMLNQRRIKSTILINGNQRRVTKVDQDGGTEVYAFHFRTPYYRKSVKSLVAWLYYYRSAIAELQSFVRERGVDIINVHFPSGMHSYVRSMKTKYGLPYVVSLHGSDMRIHFNQTPLNRFLTTRILRSADAVTAVSRDILTLTARQVDDLPKSAVVIPSGADAVFLEAGARDVQCSTPLTILMVAGLKQIKGHDVLLAAIPQLASRTTLPFRVLLAGDGPERDNLVALAGQLGIADRITFLDNLSKESLIDLYRQAAFTVLPSRSEGMGIVLMESFAMNRPVIASDVGGIPEMVEHGVNGLLFPPEDSTALAECMRTLMNDDETRRRMGAAGRAKVADNYTWKHNCEAYVQLFNRVIEKAAS